MEIIPYRPYIDHEFESLVERIHPPRVCIDNDAYQDCTLVKVDSANKQGILIEMVQVLTNLDLVISKSYISFDGGWFMDDQLGNKHTDKSLLLYMQQALCAKRPREALKDVQKSLKRDVRPPDVVDRKHGFGGHRSGSTGSYVGNIGSPLRVRMLRACCRRMDTQNESGLHILYRTWAETRAHHRPKEAGPCRRAVRDGCGGPSWGRGYEEYPANRPSGTPKGGYTS